MEPATLRVVVVRDKKIYRSELPESDLEKTKPGGQYVLPANTYSAGFCDRVWGVEWAALEWAPEEHRPCS